MGRSPQHNRVRRVVNEGDLLKLLEKYGFHRLNMEELSLRDQLSISANANCILGPHGAGMLHCLFMPPESQVFELFSPTYINPCVLPVVELLNHHYFMFTSTKNPSYDYGEDILANLFALDVSLRRELAFM